MLICYTDFQKSPQNNQKIFIVTLIFTRERSSKGLLFTLLFFFLLFLFLFFLLLG
jgi:hypothetical protein